MFAGHSLQLPPLRAAKKDPKVANSVRGSALLSKRPDSGSHHPRSKARDRSVPSRARAGCFPKAGLIRANAPSDWRQALLLEALPAVSDALPKFEGAALGLLWRRPSCRA